MIQDEGVPIKKRDVDATSTHEWVQVSYTSTWKILFWHSNSFVKDEGVPIKSRDVDSTSSHEWVQVGYVPR